MQTTDPAPVLHLLTRDTSAIAGPAQRHGDSYRAHSGVSVLVDRVPFDELYERIMLGFVTGTTAYDVLLIPSAWLADFAPYLSEVPRSLLHSPSVSDIHPAYRPLMQWQDHWLALPIDGDLHIGAYRRDLFDDESLRHAFAQQYGYPLAPPRSWQQYSDIAAFFSARTHHGHQLAGTLEAFAAGGQRLWYLFSHAAAYASHPQHPGAMYFDPQTMRPAIDNPAWVRALEEFLALRRYGPPDSSQLDSDAVRERFAAGDAAMDIDWADTAVLASDPGRSRIAGDVGFFVLPGSDQVWNPQSARWDQVALRSVTFLAFGGWIAVVPASSRQQALAWDYLAWFADPLRSQHDVLDGTSGINPYRLSQLSNPAPWRAQLGNVEADAFLQVLNNSLSAHEIARDLRLPGYRAYSAALETQLDRVIAGGVSAAQGLSAAARAWDLLTDRLGRNAQRAHYRRAMGLPPLPDMDADAADTNAASASDEVTR